MLINLLAALLLGVGLVRPATAAVGVHAALDLGLMVADGTVRTITQQSDGKLIIGGSFSLVNGVPRQNIVHLNADGSLDATWNPTGGANGPVYALAVDGSNHVYVGCAFTTLGGSTHLSLAVADKTLGTPTANSVHVGPTGIVRALARDSAGRLVGGVYSICPG